jgi:hypothetical protein
MTPWHHAVSSAKKFGGHPEDYIEIHNWFDDTKQHTGDWTHRALRHHSAGVEESIVRFGHAVWLADGRSIPVKLIAEQHVTEDCGFIPTVAHWLVSIKDNPSPWMLRVGKKSRDMYDQQLPTGGDASPTAGGGEGQKDV